MTKLMTPKERENLLQTLKRRFEKHVQRHPGMTWSEVEVRLNKSSDALTSLRRMEQTGGEPDVVVLDQDKGKASTRLTFCDCAPESPTERRSLCYDREALYARKENKPEGSAIDMASSMEIELLTEAQYRALQKLGEFDLKTSSWVVTPKDVRSLGGALFCDRRYGTVFVYHNGAQSYYAARGFRGLLRV